MTDTTQAPTLSIQTTQLIAQIVSILGMLASTFGWLTPQQVAGLTTNILAAVGPVATIAGFALSLFASRKTAIVTAVASLKEVRAVITEPTIEGHELAGNGTPSNVVVAGQVGSPIPPIPPHP